MDYKTEYQTEKTNYQTEKPAIISVKCIDDENNLEYGYGSQASVFTNSNGEKSLIISPIMSYVDIKGKYQHNIIDQVKRACAMLGYSARQCGICDFDNKSYDENDMTGDKVTGYNVIYIFPRGAFQCANKNYILRDYLDIEFMLTHNLIGCNYLLNDLNILSKSIVKIKRSSGVIQDAYFNINNAILFNKKLRSRNNVNNENNENYETLITLEFNNYTEKIEFTEDNIKLRQFYFNMYKSVTIEDFMKLNDEFVLNFTFKNPLETHADIYDKYIKGNEELETEYAEVNKYYAQELSNFVENVVRPAFSKIEDQSRIIIDIYQVE